MNNQAVFRELGLRMPAPTLLDLVKATRDGIPKRTLDALVKKLDVSLPEMAKYLHISERTLQRYEPERILSPDLSDHILQITRVYTKCNEVFEDKKDAVYWLKQPSTAFGNIPPIELMDTSTGIEMIFDELNRIEYGILS